MECNEVIVTKKEAWTEANPDAEPETNPYYAVPAGKASDVAINVLSYFERKYQCSGVCRPALFYYSQHLSAGVPTENCLTYMKNEIGDSLKYLGLASTICGVLILLIFICQYGLWFNYEDTAAPKTRSDLYFNNRD